MNTPNETSGSPGAAGPVIAWEWSSRVPGRLRGFLPEVPGTTIFLIDVDPDRTDRGTLLGAFIPDSEEADRSRVRTLVVTLKHFAEQYLQEWDEVRANKSPNATRSARPENGGAHGS